MGPPPRPRSSLAGPRQRAREVVDGWDAATLTSALQWVQLNLVRVPLDASGPTALFLVPAERYRLAVGRVGEEAPHSLR